MEKIIIFALIGIMVLLISGCTFLQSESEKGIEDEGQATETLINVSNQVEGIGSALDDIDNLLG